MLQNATAMIEGRDDLDEDAKGKSLAEINRQAEILLTGVDLNAPAPRTFTQEEYYSGNQDIQPGSIVNLEFGGREVPYMMNDKGLLDKVDTGEQEELKTADAMYKNYLEFLSTITDVNQKKLMSFSAYIDMLKQGMLPVESVGATVKTYS